MEVNMYCKNCGELLNDNDRVCPACGTPVDRSASEKAKPAQGAPQGGPQTYSYQEGTSHQAYNYNGPEYQAANDSGSAGWGILGCCFPLVGLILYLVWKDTKPKSAKSAGIGAIIGVVAIIVLYVIFFVLVGIGGVLYGASDEFDMDEFMQYLEESAKTLSWHLNF